MLPPDLTIFTPTYNRANLLERLWQSLNKQTCLSFEWLIVDDGSEDDTRTLIETLKAKSLFNISYIYKENAGKHTAINVGINCARGRFFTIVDSDDYCVSNMVERALSAWKELEATPQEYNKYSAVTFLMQSHDGKIIGNPFKQNYCTLSHIDIYFREQLNGDKFQIYRTDVIIQFPFPVFPGESFLTEGVVWNRIAKAGYVEYCINHPLLVREYHNDGLTAKGNRLYIENPRGTILYLSELLEHKLTVTVKFKTASSLYRYYFHSKNKIEKSIMEFPVVVMGYILYIKDLYKLSKCELLHYN